MSAAGASSARTEILARIRSALADVPAGETPEDVPVPRDYRQSHVDGDPVEVFTERVADYRATVARVTPDGVAAEIARFVAGRGVAGRDIVAAPGFPAGWRPAGARSDEPPLPRDELDRPGVVALTTAAVGIALTGTIVLDAGPGQGRRALTLIPDVHVCVIGAERIAADVPEALGRLDPTRPLTFISGPSATSDIELHRVEGVHGPRTLHVIVVGSTDGTGWARTRGRD